MTMKSAKTGLVVLAHTPPPLHGQSLMVERMLAAFRGQPRVYHVDCRYSDDLRAMGRAGVGKFLLAVRYALEAIAVCLRHGASTLYYVPAPGKHPAFLRDCVVLSLVRPFFKRVIFQWHAAGLAHWLQTQAHPIARAVARRIYSGHDLSIVQLEEKAAEIAWFRPRKIRVIPYGIPDSCPDFEERAATRRHKESPQPIRLLFLATATRAKGVFTAVTVWKSLNERAARDSRTPYHLTIAGEFVDRDEEATLRQHAAKLSAAVQQLFPNLEKGGVEILGGVYGERKTAAYAEADIFLFPSTYPWESFGIVLVEAAHFGLPCVTYQPLVGPRGLSPAYHRHVPMADAEAFVVAVESVAFGHGREIRADALAKFDPSLFASRMREACLNIPD